MSHFKFPLSRRTFLHGVGVTLALPWLEGMRSPASMPVADGKSDRPPVRMAVLYLMAASADAERP